MNRCRVGRRRVALMVAVEHCWNVFPSTPTSSLVLLAAHGVVLGGIWTSKRRRRRAGWRAADEPSFEGRREAEDDEKSE